MKLLRQELVEVDTEKFTKEEWKAFIKEYLPSSVIAATIQSDLFPLTRLKTLAMERALAAMKFWDEWTD